MKRLKFCLITLFAAVLLTGCNSDDNDDASESAAPRVQVTTVFAPSQLGDMGYADRVMKGVSTLRNDDSGDVEVNIISTDNVQTTRQMVTEWAATTSSTIDGAGYSRRLLVLTEPYMAEWLAAVKTQLKPTDEVLLLKANEDDVKAAAQTLDLGDRVHGLNISAAASVKRFDDARRQYCSWVNLDADADSVSLLRLYGGGAVAYRDSIDAVLTDLSPKHQAPDFMYILDKAGEQYSTEYELTAFEAAYHVCGIYYGLSMLRADSIPGQSAYKDFVISDLGSANHGAQLFLVGNNHRIAVVMLMLDAESNTDMCRFAVIRHFDRALAGWTQSWLAAPTGSMPLMEIHGGWDGYCTDDIDLEILQWIIDTKK